jgi:hypothetical protein
MSTSPTSTKNEITITQHLEKFEKVLGETRTPMLALMATISDIAVEIKASLMSQEDLATKDGIAPILECNSTECYMWAIAILSSAWTQWVFRSKSTYSGYQNDPTHPEASKNVKITLPYVKNSINDAILAGDDIARNSDTNYIPNTKKYPATFSLRKDDQQVRDTIKRKENG